jgi:hypothetical protein
MAVTTITGGGTGKARGGTGGTITGGRRVGTLRKKWKKGVYQVISEREEREEVTKGRQEGRGGGECRGRTTAHMGHGDEYFTT